MSAVDSYLPALQKELSRGDATERTHRPALKSLIDVGESDGGKIYQLIC